MTTKIVHLCTFASGGAGKAAYRLHHGLCEAGFDSTFLCLSKGMEDPTVKVIHGCSTTNMPGCADVLGELCNSWDKIIRDHPRRPPGLEMFSHADSAVRLAQLDEIRSADIVHLHWISGVAGHEELKDALRGKKVVWTLHDMNPFTGGCHYSGRCLGYLESCGACPQLGSEDGNDLSNRIWRKKNAGYNGLDLTVVTPSRWLAACAVQSSIFRNTRVVSIPNSVPIDIFQPLDQTEIKKALSIDPDAHVILFGADNLANQRKGFAYLLEALRRYRAKVDVVLAVFGALDSSITIDSPYKMVSFGAIHDEGILACVYSLADLLVIPSMEDNLPNTILESMACGTPVVGFATGGIPDMVEHKKNGYLAEQGDIEGLVSGIDWVLTNPENVRLRENCRRRVEISYAVPEQIARLSFVYGLASKTDAT